MLKHTAFDIFYYERPYKQPLLLKQGRFFAREGFILKQSSDPGVHYAEVAPFPGLQRESPGECLTQLRALKEGEISIENLFPAVKWGLYQLNQRFKPPFSHPPLFINTLISGIPETSAFKETIAQRYNTGYRCFKIKVGLLPPAVEIARLTELLTQYPEIRLRLDANQSWNYNDFRCFSEALQSSQLEYFEEPFREPSEYAKLTTQQWKQIALDESLVHGKTNSAHLACARVLKPMVLGPQALKNHLKQARQHQQAVVFSACFESAWGLSILAQEALQHAPDTPCGLDTNQAFDIDIWEPTLEIQGGKMHFDQRFFTAQYHHQLKWNTTYIRKID